MWFELAKLAVPMLYVTLSGVIVLAIWKGGRAERQGAILYLVLWLAASMVPSRAGSISFVNIFLAADGLAAFGFLWLAIRFSNLWLAGAMIAQGIAFGAHAFRLEEDLGTPRWMGVNVYLLVMNLMSGLVLTLILCGTISTWKKTARSRKAARAKLAAGTPLPA